MLLSSWQYKILYNHRLIPKLTGNSCLMGSAKKVVIFLKYRWAKKTAHPTLTKIVPPLVPKLRFNAINLRADT